MITRSRISPFTTILIILILSSCSNASLGPWIRFEDEMGKQGYINENGDTTISPGKYLQCYSDTFNVFGIVYDQTKGMIAINKDEEVLFNVFAFDNGPDYVSDGLFRIVVEGKIGYADIKGRIVIEPSFKCAYPFQEGKAKVAFDCIVDPNGEHENWLSDDWFVIDRNGNEIQ